MYSFSRLKFIVFIGFFLSVVGVSKIEAQKRSEPVDLVYPLLDAANSRWFYFNSATRPFGMVNLSPDNAYAGDWGSGYRYNSDSVKFFSHIHCWQLSGVPVLPFTGNVNPTQGPEIYGSRYLHAKEIVKPGYHKVHLEKYSIDAELTSTSG
jgi:putative alpha-1,2-mannosidase